MNLRKWTLVSAMVAAAVAGIGITVPTDTQAASIPRPVFVERECDALEDLYRLGAPVLHMPLMEGVIPVTGTGGPYHPDSGDPLDLDLYYEATNITPAPLWRIVPSTGGHQL